MLKKILNLEGAVELSREQQQSIKGGIACSVNYPCKPGSYCSYTVDSQMNPPEGICRLGQG
jgi:hypothetical protein